MWRAMTDETKVQGSQAQMRPAAWRHTIAPYCHHVPASGVVINQTDLSDAIPRDKITWTPLFELPDTGNDDHGLPQPNH